LAAAALGVLSKTTYAKSEVGGCMALPDFGVNTASNRTSRVALHLSRTSIFITTVMACFGFAWEKTN
jgi:hypothetical protein